MVIKERRRDSPLASPVDSLLTSPIDEASQLPDKLLHIDFAARQRYLVDERRCFKYAEWLFAHDLFQGWIESDNKWQLRLCGTLGSGKTTLCALAVDQLLQLSAQSSTLVVQLYLGDLSSLGISLSVASASDSQDSFSVEDFVLRAIYRQLLETGKFDILDEKVRQEPGNKSSGNKSYDNSDGKWLEFQTAFESFDNVFIVIDGLEHMSFEVQKTFSDVLATARNHGMRTLITQAQMSDASETYVYCGLESEHAQYNGPQQELCSVYWHCQWCDGGDFDVCRTCRKVRNLGCHDDNHRTRLYEPYLYRDFVIHWPEEHLRQLIKWKLHMACFDRTHLGRALNQQTDGTERLVNEICTKAMDDLALVSIYVERIIRNQNSSLLSDVLDELPEDEQAHFGRAITQLRMNSGDTWGTIEAMIAIVAHSPVPLRFDAFVEAVSFREGHKASTDLSSLDKHELMRITNGLLFVESNVGGLVRLSQTDLKTFLLECGGLQRTLQGTFMTELCLDYLNQDWLARPAPDDDYISLDIYRRHTFLAYASRFFGSCVSNNSSGKTHHRFLELLRDPDRVKAITTAAWYADNEIPWMLPLGATAFHLCAYLGLTDILYDLHEDGLYDINAKDTFYGNTAIVTACQWDYPNTVKTLLELGADPGIANYSGSTALDQAIESNSLGAMKTLVTRQGYKSYQDWLHNGATDPLHTAASSGHGSCQAVRLLLTMDQVDVNVEDAEGRSAFLASIASGNIATAALLAKHRKTDVQVRDFKGRNALHLLWDKAVKDNSWAGESELLDSCIEFLDIIFSRLPRSDRLALMNQRDTVYGRTPLMSAITAAPKNCNGPELMQVFDLLIMETDDLYQVDYRGRTLMHYAAVNNNEDLVSQLHYKGLDVNESDHVGRTPLHLSCANSCVSTVCRLYELHASPIIQDAFQESPLDYARHMGIQDLLGEALSAEQNQPGMTIDSPVWAVINSGDEDALVDMVQNRPDQVKMPEPSNRTSALHLVGSSSTGMLRALLVSDLIDPNVQDLSGRTPLHKLVEDYTSGLPLDQDEFTTRIRLLLEYGARLDRKDADNKSTLDVALARQDFETCTILVNEGAPVQVTKTQARHFPDWLAYAISCGYVGVVTKILAAGFNVHCRSNSKLLIQVAYDSRSKYPSIFDTMMQSMADFATRAMAQTSINS